MYVYSWTDIFFYTIVRDHKQKEHDQHSKAETERKERHHCAAVAASPAEPCSTSLIDKIIISILERGKSW